MAHVESACVRGRQIWTALAPPSEMGTAPRIPSTADSTEEFAVNTLSTPGVTTTSTPPPTHTLGPMHHPRRWGRVRHGVRPTAIAAVVTAAIAYRHHKPTGSDADFERRDRPRAGHLGHPRAGLGSRKRCPGWARLDNAYATAELEVKVKPADGTDPVAVLQGDINSLSNVATTGLTNVRDSSAPVPKPLQSGKSHRKPPSTTAPMGHHGWARPP